MPAPNQQPDGFGKDQGAGSDWPVGPKNKKNRPYGSGTTNAKRIASRAHKQWSALEGMDPSSAECLEKHCNLLKESFEKAQEKLEEARKQKQLEPSSSNGSSSSSAQNSSSSAASASALEKAPKRAKSVTPGGMKQQGKEGPRKAVLTPASTVLEKTNAASPVLEKTAGFASEKPKKAKKKAKNAKEEDEEMEEVTVEEEPPQRVVLEKTTKAKEAKPLVLEKTTKAKEAKPSRPRVIVDWHNTMEVGQGIPGRNIYALQMLLTKVDVVILSYVQSEWRAEKVINDINKLPCADKLLGKEVCWQQTGEDGKCHMACNWKAKAIFDDSVQICKECLDWNIAVYPINTHHQRHAWIGGGFDTFADAVDAFLKHNPDL